MAPHPRLLVPSLLLFQVLYHINITDIDDKIILRARRNKLLGDYIGEKKGAESGLSEVLADVESALAARVAKLDAKLAAAEAELAAATDSRAAKDLAAALAGTRLKAAQVHKTRKSVATVLGAAKGFGPELAARHAPAHDAAPASGGDAGLLLPVPRGRPGGRVTCFGVSGSVQSGRCALPPRGRVR